MTAITATHPISVVTYQQYDTVYRQTHTKDESTGRVFVETISFPMYNRLGEMVTHPIEPGSKIDIKV